MKEFNGISVLSWMYPRLNIVLDQLPGEFEAWYIQNYKDSQIPRENFGQCCFLTTECLAEVYITKEEIKIDFIKRNKIIRVIKEFQTKDLGMIGLTTTQIILKEIKIIYEADKEKIFTCCRLDREDNAKSYYKFINKIR